MKILLTGISGFLGSNVARLFVKGGIDVMGILRDSSDLSRLQDFENNPHFTKVFVDDIESVFKNNKIDAIVHTATSYGRKGETPEQVRQANTDFPLQLLIIGLKYGTKVFINSDTFLMIGDKDQKDRNYIVTKKSFIEEARKMIPVDYKFINMKIEQMYGPNDNPTKFIPFLVKEFLSNKATLSFNPGEQIRDYVYVDDVAKAYLQAFLSRDSLGNFEEFGVGQGKGNTLKDLIKIFVDQTTSTPTVNFGALPYHPHEVMASIADITNNSKINWKAEINLETGIAKTIEGYRSQLR